MPPPPPHVPGSVHPAGPRLSRFTLISRAFRLRCPQCGRAAIIRRWFFMPAACPACGLKLEREPGYYLGSIYINYGLTAALMTIGYMTLLFRFEMEPNLLMGLSFAFAVLFPILFFPFARCLWLAFDLAWDPPLAPQDPPADGTAERPGKDAP